MLHQKCAPQVLKNGNDYCYHQNAVTTSMKLDVILIKAYNLGKRYASNHLVGGDHELTKLVVAESVARYPPLAGLIKECCQRRFINLWPPYW